MTGFVKLHSSMLRSTIWFARPDRDIFITALLMAEPREFTQEVPQLEARSLNETGWRVPPGWYGFCEASGPGIVRTAGIDSDEGMCALERLGSPEPESRSQAFDGRRMVRVDGGFIVLNYDKYREKDTTSAERSARYRARKSRRDVTPVTRGVTCQGRSVTQAEAEAEAEAEEIIPPLAPPASTERRSSAKTEKQRTNGRSHSEGRTKAPELLEPTEATLAVATETGLDWRVQWAACRDWAWGKGELKADWQATLRGWMRRSAESSKERAEQGKPPEKPRPKGQPGQAWHRDGYWYWPPGVMPC